MNFLAHAYLSFNDPQIIAGNMISDFVKGSAKFSFGEGVQKGITLHRNIDEFTDKHPATHKAKQIFKPAYRLYSGAIMDILYDHFLANDASVFTEETLKEFSQNIYQVLETQTDQLPFLFEHIFFYMRTEDWLFNYREKTGIEKSLKGLVRRAAYLSESETAYNLFLQQYNFLNECYHQFFEDVKLFAKKRLEELRS